MWGGRTLTQHGLSLNDSVFHYWFYHLSSDFCLARLLLLLILWRWKSHRGGFRRSQQVGSQLSGKEGAWLMGAAWGFGAWRATLQAALKRVALALHATCKGWPVGERWFSDLQQRCANRGPVLARPAFSWPSPLPGFEGHNGRTLSVEERLLVEEEGKLHKDGWQTQHLTALERHSHGAKLKDRYYCPRNPKVGKLAKPSLGNRPQARERKSIMN